MPGRVKGSFAFRHTVKIASDGAPTTSSTGYYWVLTNLNKDFYDCEILRNILGVYPESFARANSTNADIVTVNSITEMCRMGIIGEVSCTIKASDPSVIFTVIGEEQKTSFVYDLSKSVKDVARELLSTEIQVGPNKIKYKIVPGTLRIKKQKSKTPHLG